MFCGLAFLYFFAILRIHAIPTPEENVESVVRRKLTEHLKPVHLEVVNKSAKEGAPPDSDHLHFSVKIVTPMFSDMSLLKARSPEQWDEERGITPPPLCQGDGVPDFENI